MNYLNYNKWNDNLEEQLYQLELIRNNIPILLGNINFSRDNVDLYKRIQHLSKETDSAMSKLVGATSCNLIDFSILDKYTAIPHWLVNIIEWRNKVFQDTNSNDDYVYNIKEKIHKKMRDRLLNGRYGQNPVRDFLNTFFAYEKQKHRNNPKYAKFINRIDKVNISQQEFDFVLSDTLKVLKSIILDTNANLVKTLKEVFGDWIFNNKYTKNINLTNVINKLKT